MFKYQCGSCDKWHEGPPCLAFVVPDIVQTIPSADVARRVTGDENICVVDGTHFFIRASLRMPIIGEEGEFDWSLWVSVSEASFMDYYDTYEAGGAHGPYFSWLGNQLPAYPTSEGLRCQTLPQEGNERPIVEVERSDHPISRHVHEGMPRELAIAIFTRLSHPTSH